MSALGNHGGVPDLGGQRVEVDELAVWPVASVDLDGAGLTMAGRPLSLRITNPGKRLCVIVPMPIRMAAQLMRDLERNLEPRNLSDQEGEH